MARKPKILNIQDLRAFRHKVSQLKAKGLTSKRTDARKQRPTRYMVAKVANLEPVLRGEAVGVKVTRALSREYKAAGFNVVNGRVVVEKNPAEIASVRKGLPLLRRHIGGGYYQERLILPYGPKNFDQLRERYEENPKRFENLKSPDEQFAFKIYGNNSLATFMEFDLLLEYLEHYQTLEGDEAEESFAELILYRVNHWSVSPKRRRVRTEQDRRGPRVRGKLMGPDNYRRSEAKRKQEYRAGLSLEAANNTREKTRQRVAALRAAKSPGIQKSRLLENIQRKDARRADAADRRNGFKPT